MSNEDHSMRNKKKPPSLAYYIEVSSTEVHAKEHTRTRVVLLFVGFDRLECVRVCARVRASARVKRGSVVGDFCPDRFYDLSLPFTPIAPDFCFTSRRRKKR